MLLNRLTHSRHIGQLEDDDASAPARLMISEPVRSYKSGFIVLGQRPYLKISSLGGAYVVGWFGTEGWGGMEFGEDGEGGKAGSEFGG